MQLKNNKKLQLLFTMLLQHVPTINMPLKCHICQLDLVHISDNYVSIFTLYELTAINNVTIHNDMHTFHIIGICPPDKMFSISHGCPTALVIQPSCRPPHYCTFNENKTMNCNFIYHAISIYEPATNMHLKCHTYLLLHMQILDNFDSIHTSHELPAMINLTRSTCMHTFHITVICPWRNMSTTLHIYVPMQ